MDLNLITQINNNENNSFDITLKKKYDYNKKMDLVKKINKIKKKEYLANIFKIILLYSKDYTENNNGVFVFFHNLDDEAYAKLENYVNLIYKMHKKQNDNILNVFTSEISDSVLITSDTVEINNNKELSNREKMIMKRKKYEEYLTQNQQ
jgi:hypothetical protein